MYMNAMILGTNVRENTFYDQVTGVGRPGYSVNMSVLDRDSKEKYEVQVNDGFDELEELKQLRQQGATQEQYEDAVNRLRTNLPEDYSFAQIEVLRIKGKGTFLTLVCRFLQAVAEAAA